MGLEEKLPSGFLLTTVEKLASYMRRNSLWPATFGLACCAIEMMAVGGGQVWQGFLDGKIKEIRDYCETDVVNTYLVYCRFQRMRGGVSPEEYQEEVQFVKSELLKESKTPQGAFWQEYLDNFSKDSQDIS